MPRVHRLRQVDVFTERPFGGNALAVVLDAEGLADAEMQAIARETNLAETTFVLPATRPDCVARVRIFTPARELPFAGHPTLGTAWVLAAEGRHRGAPRFALEEGVGPVPVALEGAASAPAFVWMEHGDPTFGPPRDDRGDVARALGLDERDVLPAPVCTGSTGIAFLYVPLRDRAAVDRAAADAAALARVLDGGDVVGAFLFAPDGPARVYSRMFAPSSGIPEDPATGSASGPLIAYLVAHGLVPATDPVRIVSEQGTKMRRQSFVHVTARVRDGRAAEIRVGGAVVPVLDGRLAVP